MSENNKTTVLKEVRHTVIDNDKDSLEIGSATKGGKIKCYGDSNKPDEFKAKIDKAKKLRAYANLEVNI